MSHLLRVDLGSPVVISSYSSLDGILAWCAVQEASAMGTLDNYDACHSTLPIDKVYFDDSYFYRASSWFLDEGAQYGIMEHFIHRRFPLESLPEFLPNHKAKIQLGLGPDKDYRIPLYPMSVNRLNFLFEGDAEAVGYLVRKWLMAVGKETPVGYGFVKAVNIQKDDRDPVLFGDGSVRRPVPLEAAAALGVKTGFELTAIASYQPPYPLFEPARQKICLMPNKKKILGEVL